MSLFFNSLIFHFIGTLSEYNINILVIKDLLKKVIVLQVM